MKIKRGNWIHMTGCIIEAIEDSNGIDCHGEVVRITDESMAKELDIHIGLVDYWEVIDREPLNREEKLFWLYGE